MNEKYCMQYHAKIKVSIFKTPETPWQPTLVERGFLACKLQLSNIEISKEGVSK
jgi:hypothetical protein